MAAATSPAPRARRQRPMFTALWRAQGRDVTLARHGWNVGWLAFLAADRAGIGGASRPALFRAGLLHDFGKLWIDPRVLYKPGKLDAEEWELVKRHVQHGSAALSAVGLDAEAFLALGHHERPDGGGYPFGLAAAELSRPVCVLSAADAFCAMIETRGYAPAVAPAAALGELEAASGSQFAQVAVSAIADVVNAPAFPPRGLW